MKNNTKQFWSYMKGKKQDSQGVTPLRKDDGFLYSDTETKAGILNDHFHSVYTREDMTDVKFLEKPRENVQILQALRWRFDVWETIFAVKNDGMSARNSYKS